MQTTFREEATQDNSTSVVQLKVPARLVEPLHRVLGPLVRTCTLSPFEVSATADTAVVDDIECVRISESAGTWVVEAGERRQIAPDEELALLCVQELLLRTVAKEGCLLIRGSVVARGSQCLLIVGDRSDADAMLATALSTIGFHPVSVGMAVVDARSLVPRSLPLTFHLNPADQQALKKLDIRTDECLERVWPALFRATNVGPAGEPTHVLFLEIGVGSLSVVKPIAGLTARTRLCHALVAAPEDQPQFAAVAAVMRHSRGVHLTLGDLSGALEQLGRLLPWWKVG